MTSLPMPACSRRPGESWGGPETSRGESEQFLLQAFRSLPKRRIRSNALMACCVGEVARLHGELEQSNAGLARSLEENRADAPTSGPHSRGAALRRAGGEIRRRDFAAESRRPASAAVASAAAGCEGSSATSCESFSAGARRAAGSSSSPSAPGVQELLRREQEQMLSDDGRGRPGALAGGAARGGRRGQNEIRKKPLRAELKPVMTRSRSLSCAT